MKCNMIFKMIYSHLTVVWTVHLCGSDRPQMVSLNRCVPSEFGASRMRESFMRQFIDQGDDLDSTADSQKNADYQPPHVVANDVELPLLSVTLQKSLASTVEKKSHITDIIRFENLFTAIADQIRESFSSLTSTFLVFQTKHHTCLFRDSNRHRIISEDGVQVTIPGTKSLLSKQHQVRLDIRR